MSDLFSRFRFVFEGSVSLDDEVEKQTTEGMAVSALKIV
jgi:hypothetical protein